MTYILVILFLLNGFPKSFGNSVLEHSELESQYGVHYDTYTEDNRNDRVDIRDVNFKDNQTTVFIIHGYLTFSLKRPLNLKDGILAYMPNVGRVIVVSWLDYSIYSDATIAPFNYNKIASEHVPSLAQDVFEKLMFICNNGAETIKLVGHSLGAHVAGQAGKLFHEETGKVIDEIIGTGSRTGFNSHKMKIVVILAIGLDPAGPYFRGNQKDSLKSTDATEVLVFHTNTGRYGNKENMGTQDIFVNGGKRQPKCVGYIIHLCSHEEAWQIFSNYLKDRSLHA